MQSARWCGMTAPSASLCLGKFTNGSFGRISAPRAHAHFTSEDRMREGISGSRVTRRQRIVLTTAVASALCAAGGNAVHAEDVEDWHTFKAAPAAPLAGQGTNDPVVGSLTGNTAAASFLIGYLDTPLTLTNVGDQISFSFGVRFNDTTAISNQGDNFRFALFDENGQTRVTANETAT